MAGGARASKAWTVAFVGLCVALAAGVAWYVRRPRPTPPPAAAQARPFDKGRRLTVWWDEPPPAVLAGTVPTGPASNIHPADYTGPDACRNCHAENYATWTTHSHHGMNALATPATVKGDFSGAGDLDYLGGRVSFYRKGDQYYMGLARDGLRRAYHITQTIGVRFYQRYVGKQIEGPEPPGHPFYSAEHVLPFGYWLPQQEWVPIIHVGPEVPDDERPDPFLPPDSGPYYAEYSISCNYCHTTFPLGDLFGRFASRIGEHAPAPLHWALRPYLQSTHPEQYPAVARAVEQVDQGVSLVRNPMGDWEALRFAVTLGISCEACHLGGREHVASGGKVPPRFSPASPYLAVEGTAKRDTGRTHDNVNWACGRCHTGGRPKFAAGMSTWNSVEYADAVKGSCYSQLKCVDCHNPHRPIGPRWTASPEQDDARCLKCHGQFEPAAARTAHTHHPAGSDGARCMNCHMPKINEGLYDVVRTHMITSPTRADMLEANHPNACNLCHTREPVDWTLRYLREWYGKTYDEAKLAAAYPQRNEPVARGWLHSPNQAVRLVAVETLARRKETDALPQLLDALDDPYLENRQFAYKGLQEMLGARFRDFGYRVTQTHKERTGPVAAIRERFCPARR